MAEDDSDELTTLEHLTNPAGRLFLVFDAVRAQLQEVGDVETRALLHTHYDMDPSVGDAAYFSVIAELMQQPIQARAAISSLEGPGVRKSFLYRPYEHVEAAIPRAAVPGMPASTFYAGIDSAVLQGLEFGSAALFERKLYRAVDGDSLKNIRDLASTILDELAQAKDLPRDVREALRVHAQRIVTAADSYRVSGSDGLTDSLDGIVGAVILSGPRAPGLLNHPFVQKIRELANLITAVTTIGVAATAIGAGVSDMFAALEPPTPSVVEVPTELDCSSLPPSA
ncbi:hypothetical protein [Microbacterium testaceum]|uniref:hypothetical protein n=1 Tax=Microbacterium testaceum TaxID=2033 RepID=UPI0025B1F953|nr:hypothetical protein [Microbacterium testaceum]WJS89938.1 hypothetical protein NYQ11_11450 [Microbacterium testaceum]